MKTILAIALAAVATPAFADPVANASPAPTAIANPDQRVCVVVPAHTGTIIDRKVCRTRAEWTKRGIDPFAKAQ